MNIGEKLKKDPWIRRVHPDLSKPRFVGGYKPASFIPGSYNYITLTQQDFLNELSPASHPVNSTIMSKRPIYGPTGKQKDGKDEWAIVGYDDVEVVPLGWQEFICNNKVAHLATDGFDLANETEMEDAFNKLMSWFDYIGIKDAFKEACYYAERSGDAGIYIRQTRDDRIEWDVYSIEKGYTIYPQLDDDGDPMYYIAYVTNGRNAVDIISKRGTETWIQNNEKVDEKPALWEWVAKMIEEADGNVRSEDGYVRVKFIENQLGGDVQFVYFRVPDVSWGPAQLTIESLENACSYVAEEVKNSAFPILFLKSEKIVNLPPSKTNGKTLGVKGSSDSLAHSDAKFLTPPDASNIATLHIKELRDNIIHTTMTAIIEPEIMKQGADSSTSIKILFRPEIEWATLRWIYYLKPVRHLVDLAKGLVQKIDGASSSGYDGLRMSIWQSVWIPENEAERVKIELDQYYAGVKSAKAVMTDIGNIHLGDWDQIMKEKEEKLALESKYKQSNSNESNPDFPRVTNQAENQPEGK